MNTSAIHQAIRLNKYPDEMEWLTLSDSEYPEGITDLLRLCASTKRMESFSQKYHIGTDVLSKILLNFIRKVILKETNSEEKLLGLDSYSDAELIKFHYQLLIKIFHPDVNTSSYASSQTSRITNAYNHLKRASKPSEIEFKNITLSRVPPKSFYNATRKAEQQISGFKTAFLAMTGIALVSVAIIITQLIAPNKPELVSRTDTISSSPDKNVFESTFSLTKLENTFEIDTSDLALQNILRDLEGYYENGTVEQIKPILANSPEIGNQSDEQIQAKLETLFKITQERKMLLYDFEWLNISGNMKGSGKFLSRYQMIGEESWKTRKGNAFVTAEDTKGQLNITSFKLENTTID